MFTHDASSHLAFQSIKIILEFIKDTLLGRRVALEVLTFSQCLYGFPLITRQSLRHKNTDLNHLVTDTLAISLNSRQPLASQPERLSGLGAWLYANSCLFAVDGGHLYLTAQSRRREVKQQVVDYILVVAHERAVILLLNVDLNIATDTVVGTCIAFARHIDYHAVGDTSRYLYFNNFVAFDDTGSLTMLTLVLDDSAFTMTRSTLRLRLHHTKHGMNGLYHHTMPVTRRTRLRTTSSLGTRAMTVVANYVFVNLELLSDTCGNLLQTQLNTQSQISAPILRPLMSSATTKAAEATETTVTTEDVSERTEDVIHGESATTKTTTEASARCIKAELIILLTLLRVVQHVIGLGSLLKFLLGFLIARITIWMVFDGQTPVGFPYLFFSSAFGYAQHLIIVSLLCHDRIFLVL